MNADRATVKRFPFTFEMTSHLLETGHALFEMQNLPFGIWHLSLEFGICPLEFEIHPLEFGICLLEFTKK
jgi:hypothetical protein